MDYYVFRKVLLSSVLLAGPGVAIGMLLVAGTTMLLCNRPPDGAGLKLRAMRCVPR